MRKLFDLARRLIDIESTTGSERRIGEYLREYLAPLAARYEGAIELWEVEPDRFNVFASWGRPVVTLSTHQDTVPPFIPSSEDEEFIWGRGACDVKGLLAAMLVAAEELLEEGVRDFALLFVVGEERNSVGAFHAARCGRGSRYLINGEPTENKLALGSKGALRYELYAEGRMAHSAYPELGESAIEKLLDVLEVLRRLELPRDELLGPSTLNIGTIAGGRAPNIIPDFAKAEVMIRLVSDAEPVRELVRRAAAGRVRVEEVLAVPAVRLTALDGFETTVVAYTTDIPAFGDAWGRPFLIGPGSIHLAHTAEERVPKRELVEAVGIYKTMVKRLLSQG